MINYDFVEKHRISHFVARNSFWGKYFGYWGAPDEESLKEYLNKFNITVQNSKNELFINNI